MFQNAQNFVIKDGYFAHIVNTANIDPGAQLCFSSSRQASDRFLGDGLVQYQQLSGKVSLLAQYLTRLSVTHQENAIQALDRP